jgi:hypothetical protein
MGTKQRIPLGGGAAHVRGSTTGSTLLMLALEMNEF